jgi:hypothetical protein
MGCLGRRSPPKHPHPPTNCVSPILIEVLLLVESGCAYGPDRARLRTDRNVRIELITDGKQKWVEVETRQD